MTLAQRLGWLALIAWEMWLILGPAIANAVKKVAVKTHRGNTHFRRTGDGGIYTR